MKKTNPIFSVLFLVTAILVQTAIAGNEIKDCSKKKIPGPITAVQQHRGKPTFMLNGEPFTKPIFETYAPETKYFQDFADAGCAVYSFSTNLGNGFGPAQWVGPDKWDFSELDARAHRVLEADPDAMIMPRILIWGPEWWKRQNLDELLVIDDGTKVFNNQFFESVGSEKWRKEMADGLRYMIEHIQASDYAEHMFGYMVQGMATEEWYHRVLNAEPLADYSEHNRQAFIRWLRNKYQTVENLQKAWSDSLASFDTAIIPAKPQRIGDKNKTFRNPKTDMRVIDFYLFNSDIVIETVDHFAKVAKDVTGGTKVVGAFYGFMFEFTGDPEFGHNALGKYLESPNLDFMMVTASYGNRFVGKGSDYVRSPATSVALHNKLWYHDNDTISYLYPKVMTRIGYKPEQAEYEGSRLGGTKTAQESLWIYQRGAGFVLGGGFFQSFFDLHGGYYHSPELVQGFGELYKVFEESKSYDRTSVSEILVVSDEISCSYAGFRSPLLAHSLYHPQSTLTKIGAPHDSVLIDDLALVDPDQYKLVIFLNVYHLTDAQRGLIKNTVLKDNKTVLWCYAPGLFNLNSESVSAMESLAGIKIVRSEDGQRDVPKVELAQSSDPLAKALSSAGLSVMGPGSTYKQWTGAYTEGAQGGISNAPAFQCDLFYVDDPEAETLGTLPGKEHVTLAAKKVDGWTSVYVITPNLPAAFYRELARNAGVHIYHEQDNTLYASKSYLTVCAEKAGPKTIKLTGRFDVIDPFTNKCMYRNVTEFTKELKQNETLLVRLGAVN